MANDWQCLGTEIINENEYDFGLVGHKGIEWDANGVIQRLLLNAE